MSWLSKVGNTLIKPIDQLARSERVGKATRVVAGTATEFIPGIQIARGIQTRSLKGAARGIVGQTGFGKLGLLAYDAKRLREKSKNKIGAYRVIRKQALKDAQTIEERLASNAAPGSRPIGGLYDTISPPPDINLGPGRVRAAQEGTALEGPDLMSYLTRGASDSSIEAPAQGERGAGGDAREGVDVQLAGGKGLIPLFLVSGLILAAWAAHRGHA